MFQPHFKIYVQILTDINNMVYFLNMYNLYQPPIPVKRQYSNFQYQRVNTFFLVVLISLWNNKVYNYFFPNVVILIYSAWAMRFLLYFKILPHVNFFRNGKSTQRCKKEHNESCFTNLSFKTDIKLIHK